MERKEEVTFVVCGAMHCGEDYGFHHNPPVGEAPKKPEPFLRDRFGQIGKFKGGKGKNPR